MTNESDASASNNFEKQESTPEDNTASDTVAVKDATPTPDTSEVPKEVTNGAQIVAFVNRKIEYFSEVIQEQDAKIADLAHRYTVFVHGVESAFGNFEEKMATQISLAVENAFAKQNGAKPSVINTDASGAPKPTLIEKINLKELFNEKGEINYQKAFKMLSGEINLDAKSIKEVVDNFGDVIRGIMNLWDEVAVRLGLKEPSSVASGILPNSQGFTERDLQLLKYVTESMLKKSTQETINRIKREWKIEIPTDLIAGTLLDTAPKLIRVR